VKLLGLWALDTDNMASGGRRGLAGLNAYERHKKFVHDYLTFYGGKLPSREPGDATVKTDWDSVKEHHRSGRGSGHQFSVVVVRRA